MDKVKTEYGDVSGMVLGEPGREVRVYRGIPYAAPPVGDLRWKPPQPAAPWRGVRECTAFREAPPQLMLPMPGSRPGTTWDSRPRPPIPQSEDCLYLNILTPARKASDKLPVMVWMHGGGFVFGSANEPVYNMTRLPGYGVVLVNVGMRIGPMGLAAHRLLSQESSRKVSGNYMCLDMIAALEWVQRNIAGFGGDADNITIFGESGGGAKVVALTASPLAKRLFHRTIAESGSPEGKSLAELEAMGDKFFARLGVDKEKDPLKAARALPWQKIIETEQKTVAELHITNRGGLWDVAVDGWFLPDKPLDIFKAGKQNAVPYMLTANLGETSTGPGAYLVPTYLGLFSGAAKTGVKGHALIFDQVPGQWRREGCFSFHAVELGYVFGDWDNSSGFWEHIMNIAGVAGARSADPGLTETDKKISEISMGLWTQYAKTGDPSLTGVIDWPPWDKNTDRYLFIHDAPQVKTGYSGLARA